MYTWRAKSTGRKLKSANLVHLLSAINSASANSRTNEVHRVCFRRESYCHICLFLDAALPPPLPLSIPPSLSTLLVWDCRLREALLPWKTFRLASFPCVSISPPPPPSLSLLSYSVDQTRPLQLSICWQLSPSQPWLLQC